MYTVYSTGISVHSNINTSLLKIHFRYYIQQAEIFMKIKAKFGSKLLLLWFLEVERNLTQSFFFNNKSAYFPQPYLHLWYRSTTNIQ